MDSVTSVTKPMTVPALLLALGVGLGLALVLTAANLYLGLYAGMTVSASIPAAVLGLALYRALKRRDIHGVNLVQTLASSGESLAAGALFTVPSMVLAGAWARFPFWPTFLMAMSGSLLGIVFMVPLRRRLMEDARLRFPEGVACAAVLQAGHSETKSDSGRSLRDLFWGLASGAGFKVMTGMAWLAGTVEGAWRSGRGVVYAGIDASPALLAVGYLTGPSVALQVFAGGFLAWAILPGMNLADTSVAPLDLAWSTWSQSLRYLGAGTMIVAGLWSLVQSLPLVMGVFRGSKGEGQLGSGVGTLPAGASLHGLDVGANGSGVGTLPAGASQHGLGAKAPSPSAQATSAKREGAALGPAGSVSAASRSQDRDIEGPLWWTILILALGCVFGLYSTLLASMSLAALATILVAIASFVWVAVSSHIVGLVGSSNNPVSGMTLSALLGTALLLLMAGFQGNAGVTATLGVAAVVCCAACAAADCSQDLKTGYILGTSPRWQQLFEVVGAIFPALLIAPVLNLLHQAYGIGTGLKAPQATLFAHLAQGVFGQGHLPMNWMIGGLVLGFVLVAFSVAVKSNGVRKGLQSLHPGLAKLEIHPMAVAVGMYLPFSLSAPIAIGGIVHAFMVRRSGPSGAESGTLFASGLVAGEALTGVALALLVFFHVKWPSAPWSTWPTLGNILTLAALIWVAQTLYSKHRQRNTF